MAAAIGTAIKLFAAITEVVAFAITGFAQLYGDISGFVTGVVQFFTVDLPNAIDTLVQWFAQLPGNVAAFLSMAMAMCRRVVADMAANAVNAGSRFFWNCRVPVALPGNDASWLAGVISTVIGWVSQFASNGTSAAAQFASNLINGLAPYPVK